MGIKVSQAAKGGSNIEVLGSQQLLTYVEGTLGIGKGFLTCLSP
jgi:hypothetical protein